MHFEKNQIKMNRIKNLIPRIPKCDWTCSLPPQSQLGDIFAPPRQYIYLGPEALTGREDPTAGE